MRNTPSDSALLDLEKEKIKLIESHLQSSQTSVPQDDCHQFLMSLHKPLINLPFNRQMYVRFKFQELIFQETTNAVNYQHFVNRSTQNSNSEHSIIMSTTTAAEYSDPQSISSAQSLYVIYTYRSPRTYQSIITANIFSSDSHIIHAFFSIYQ